VLARAQGPACDPNCPTWIAADGRIVPGTAEKLRQVIQSLAGRRLPILVNSRGGATVEAMAMGRLIRHNGLSVAVAQTTLTWCRPTGKTCDDQRAAASAAGAVCASACSFVLAGGVRRYVGGFVGVHESMTLKTVTRTLRRYEIFYRIVGGRKKEIARRLVSEKSATNSTVSAAGDDIERSVADYFAEMGVGEPALRLTLTTPSSSIHWLTTEELRDSRLATHVLTGLRPIGNGAGLNGLEATTIGADGETTGDLLAEGAAPLALGDGRAAEVTIRLTYRPAGGNARLDFAVRDALTKEAVQAGRNGALLSIGPEGPAKRLDAAPLRMTVPLSLLCQLRGARTATLTLFDAEAGTNGAWPPVPIDIGALAGAKSALDEACPPGLSTGR
jgi:hypothetical protein